jgi:phage baseplate assembly protein W
MTMSATRPPSFLGRGWSFPVVAAAGPDDVAMAQDAEDIRQAILIILRTAKGERVMRPDFGCGLQRLVFQPMSAALKTLARKEVEEALIAWEPRIDVATVTVTEDARARGTLLIDIRYLVRATNTFYNLVYPFFLLEQRP